MPMTTSIDDSTHAPGAVPEGPPEPAPSVRARSLRVLPVLAVVVAAVVIVPWSFNFLRDSDASRLLVVVVAIAIGVGGVFFMFWAANRVVDWLPGRWSETVRPYVFIGPALVTLTVFLVYPVINTVLSSFKDANGKHFVGL